MSVLRFSARLSLSPLHLRNAISAVSPSPHLPPCPCGRRRSRGGKQRRPDLPRLRVPPAAADGREGRGRAKARPPPPSPAPGRCRCPSPGRSVGPSGGACDGRRGVSRKWPYWIHSAASSRGGESRAPAAGAAPAPAMAATDLERFSVSSGPALLRASPGGNHWVGFFFPSGGVCGNYAGGVGARAAGGMLSAASGAGRRRDGVGRGTKPVSSVRGESVREGPAGGWEAPRPWCSV